MCMKNCWDHAISILYINILGLMYPDLLFYWEPQVTTVTHWFQAACMQWMYFMYSLVDIYQVAMYTVTNTAEVCTKTCLAIAS